MSTQHHTLKSLIAALLLAFAAVPAFAGVSAAEAAKLKTTLMPLGGERAGNKDGTIPAWDGGTRQVVSNDGRIPNPFGEDKPLFTIDAKNAAKVCDQLKPRVIIPMHFKSDKIGFPISGVEDFLKSKSNVTRVGSSEIEISAASLPASARIMVLKQSL